MSKNTVQSWLVAIVLIGAILFGGGTHIGFFGEVIIQILAIFLLTVSVWSWAARAGHTGHNDYRSPLSGLLAGIGLLLLATIVVQLAPLPSGIWKALHPSLVGVPSEISPALTMDWRSVSLTPSMTWAVSLSLLAPVSVFLAVMQFDFNTRQRLTDLVVLLGAVSLVIGLLQVAQGADSALRFYEITNPTDAVGFFANRNHFAALLYVTLVFSAVRLTSLGSSPDRRHMLNSHTILLFVIAAVLLIALTAGLAAARSRAGVVLAVGALIGVAAMMLKSGKIGDSATHPGQKVEASGGGRMALVILVFATLFAVQFGLHKTLPRFQDGVQDGLRDAFSQTTLETAMNTMPFGTGLGSFVQVYGVAEKQNDLFRGYGNRAHNDFAEFLLEAGLPAAVIMALFAGWFAWRGIAIWFGKTQHTNRQILLLQQAASITVLLLLAHSLVDYPLRTTAMATLFAFATALMLKPFWQSEASRPNTPVPPVQSRNTDHLGPKRVIGGQIETGIKWPEAWQKKDG